MVNLASNLAATAGAHADRVAVRVGETAMSYRELDLASAQVAALLRERGLRPGGRVGIMLPNVAEFAVIYYGVLRAGGVIVPMNPLLKKREVAYYLADSGAQLIFAWHAFADEARGGARQADADAVVVDPATFADLVASAAPDHQVAYRDAEDTAVILYTSGTTGRPKGAELTHANLGRNTDVVCTDVMDLSPGDVIFGGLALLAQPDKAAYDLSALRLCMSGGAALPVEVLRGFEEAFGCLVLEGYGLSETSPVASFNHPDRARKPGSIGTPIRGVQMRVVDSRGHEVSRGEVGEIVIRGHNVMKGYWRRPEETAEAIRDGWFRTGDLGRVDEDGYFVIVDRKKDMIIRGGYNVYPREIEEVLYEHPAVAEAAVIGLPHPALGEEVGAAVAVKPGASVTADELRNHVKKQVAAYKYPRKVWIVDALPKGPTGKILKRDIVIPRLDQ